MKDINKEQEKRKISREERLDIVWIWSLIFMLILVGIMVGIRVGFGALKVNGF